MPILILLPILLGTLLEEGIHYVLSMLGLDNTRAGKQHQHHQTATEISEESQDGIIEIEIVVNDTGGGGEVVNEGDAVKPQVEMEKTGDDHSVLKNWIGEKIKENRKDYSLLDAFSELTGM